jgi:hypothetical protein
LNPKYSWNVSIPFFKSTAEPFGRSFVGPYVLWRLIIVVLLGATNAVNLTDGLDGSGHQHHVYRDGALTAFTYLSSNAKWASYLDLTHLPEGGRIERFLWRDGRSQFGVSLVQRAAGRNFHGRRRQSWQLAARWERSPC